MVFVPASVSTMGSAGPEGVNMTVTKTSESKLYKRCVVNNAAYDYYTRCQPEDLNITQPPKDLRIWLFHKLRSGSSMMQKNEVSNNDLNEKSSNNAVVILVISILAAVLVVATVLVVIYLKKRKLK